MINISKPTECCGCNACVQACPKSCISFDEDREDLVVDFQAITSQKNGGSKIFCHQFCHRQPALMLLFWRVAVTKIGKISNFASLTAYFVNI